MGRGMVVGIGLLLGTFFVLLVGSGIAALLGSDTTSSGTSSSDISSGTPQSYEETVYEATSNAVWDTSEDTSYSSNIDTGDWESVEEYESDMREFLEQSSQVRDRIQDEAQQSGVYANPDEEFIANLNATHDNLQTYVDYASARTPPDGYEAFHDNIQQAWTQLGLYTQEMAAYYENVDNYQDQAEEEEASERVSEQEQEYLRYEQMAFESLPSDSSLNTSE